MYLDMIPDYLRDKQFSLCFQNHKSFDMNLVKNLQVLKFRLKRLKVSQIMISDRADIETFLSFTEQLEL